jgi:hypothetical protein
MPCKRVATAARGVMTILAPASVLGSDLRSFMLIQME